ncbi:hypothetical protein LTR08_006745 [Meristemomyces frigidus]|nr:hypothetical protein LTR08_006745 [Meristemomyces frigidus]
MSHDRPRARRPLYAPPPSRSHGLLSYWVPLVVTGTLAIGGLAAWVWAERSEHDADGAYPHAKPSRPPGGGGSAPPQQQQQQQQQQGSGGAAPVHERPPPSQSAGPQGAPPPVGGEAASYYGDASAQRSRSRGRDDYAPDHDDDDDDDDDDGPSFLGTMRGVIARTPSPQQFFDHASQRVTAGFAAAGGVLGSIMEDGDGGKEGEMAGAGGQRRRRSRGGEEREGFSDHERWSEEAYEAKTRGGVEGESERRAVDAVSREQAGGKGRPARKTVAVVVTADTNMDGKMDDQDIVYTEHAVSTTPPPPTPPTPHKATANLSPPPTQSILSHLPAYHDPSKTDLYILIHAPGLASLPPLTYQPRADNTDTASNLGSSYSQIPTPKSELKSISPRIDATLTPNNTNHTNNTTAANPPAPASPSPPPTYPSPGRQFDALYQQAQTLVSHPSSILPFTTRAGYIPLLRHLAPQLVYVSDLLAGPSGSTLSQLKGWVGGTVLVVGDDGTGGLADSSGSEGEREGEGDAERERDDGGGEGGAGVRNRGGRGSKGDERREMWYDRSTLVGLGKEVEIVDAARVGEDWGRRVLGL